MSDQTNTDVAVRLFSDDDLRQLKTMDDLEALINERDLAVTMISDELGDGFTLLEKKDSLIGKPLIVITWAVSKGDIGEFATLRVMTKDGGKFIINDGSTGILAQVQSLISKGKQPPLWVPKGLRVSRYTVDLPDKNGELKPTPAETFYLDTSAQ